jgi:hypothetical protein
MLQKILWKNTHANPKLFDSIETTLLGIKRTPTTNSMNPTWKVRVA